jgi:hypothetical protein
MRVQIPLILYVPVFFLFAFCNSKNSNSVQEGEIVKKEEEIQQKQIENEKLAEENKKIKEDNSNLIKEQERVNLGDNLDYYLQIIPHYKVLDLGGIENAYLSLTNNYKYPLHDISISISYMKANGDVFKVEAINCGVVPVGETVDVSVPSSARGVKLETFLVRVYCSDIDFSYNTGAKAY